MSLKGSSFGSFQMQHFVAVFIDSFHLTKFSLAIISADSICNSGFNFSLVLALRHSVFPIMCYL